MYRLYAFIQKEFRHILRDRRTLLILFGMPFVQVLLFGFVLTNEIKDASIAVYDPSKDTESTRILQKVLASGYFKLNKNLESPAEIEPAFKNGSIKLALIFPSEFAPALARGESPTVQIIGDASDPNTATTLNTYVQAIIMDYQAEKSQGPGIPRIEIQTQWRYNPEMRSVFSFVPGVMTLILMLVSTMMTSITIAKEKEMGTMEVLLASPLEPWQIILGKTTPYLALSFVNAAMVVLLGIHVFKMPMNGSVWLLSAESGLYMLVALSLGIFISTKAQTQQQAMFLSALGLMMPTMLLSGFIFPRESMPLPLQLLGNIIPATWFNPIVKGIMLKGVGFSVLRLHTAVLALMAAVFIGLSVKNFKHRLT